MRCEEKELVKKSFVLMDELEELDFKARKFCEVANIPYSPIIFYEIMLLLLRFQLFFKSQEEKREIFEMREAARAD